MRSPTGVLLVNLGTPDAPTPRAVRKYLREFLGDSRVLDMNAALRWLLLNAIILPFRPRRSAAAYEQIWTDEGSPLWIHGQALAHQVGVALGPGFTVELAMRYGAPSIDEKLDGLLAAGARRIVALPLYPQYAAATTASTLAALHTSLARHRDIPALTTLGPFYEDPGFIRTAVEIASPLLEEFRAEHVLFSYHGLPEHQIRAGDETGQHCLASASCCEKIGAANAHCYRAQCHATTRALVEGLGLEEERTSLGFQSRLGRTPWIRPYTDSELERLAGCGVRRIAVLCPSFVADCLETLEEIGIRGRERWQQLGGEELLLVPCVNAQPTWVEAVAHWIRNA